MSLENEKDETKKDETNISERRNLHFIVLINKVGEFGMSFCQK